MLFRTTFFSVLALLAANQVVGAAIEPVERTVEPVERAILIATSPYYACNCPNNCSYKKGTSCKYYSGPSDKSEVIKGKCEWVGSQLTCIGQ